MKPLMAISSFRYTCLTALGLISAASAHAQNPVTFQVDMTQQPSATDVFVRGAFNNWGNPDVYANGLWLTNNGSGVYTNTVDIAGSAGNTVAYKFFFNPGDSWESPASTCGNDRVLTLAGGAQTLPVVYWNDAPPVLPPNDVTFHCDMTAQVLTGAFTNGVDEIRVSGGFNGWGGGDLLTNNPSLSGPASNIYTAVLNVAGVPGACQSYKFRSKGGWESPASTGGNNRTFQLAGGNQALALVYYNDATPCDLVQVDTLVTFVVHMTNGTPSSDGSIIFDKTVNNLYLNGEFLGWWAWNDGITGGHGPQNQLTNHPIGSDYFQQTFTIPPGKSLNTIYKYSIDGFDNEAGFAVNHGRYIRSLSGVPYTMPQDRFGTNVAPPLVEASFGSLVVASPAGGNIPVTWSGRQCVTLQTKDTITGSWQNVSATEGTSATNWPNSGGNRFFRLQKTP